VVDLESRKYNGTVASARHFGRVRCNLMARKRLLECSFFIPIRRDRALSDGEEHAAEAWLWLQDQLFPFGGATRAIELYEGWYEDRDTGQRVTDLSRRYVVAVPAGKVKALWQVLRQACGVFQQKCIYLSVVGQVEFVEGKGYASS
jgi:hypothetical protein